MTDSRYSFLRLSVAVALTGSCADSGPAPESADLSALPVWAAEAELAIGREDDVDYALTPIGGIAATPDGGVLISQPQDRHVRVFDADGRFVRAIGREGDGPGEFRRLYGVGLIGDSIWAVDGREHVFLQYFTRDGEWLRMRRMPAPERPLLGGQTYYPLADGGILMPTASSGDMITREHEQPWLRWDASDSLIARLPGYVSSGFGIIEHTRMLGGRSIDMPIPITRPLTARTWLAPAPDASWIVRAGYVADENGPGAELRVVRYTPAGDTVAQATLPVVRQPVPQQVSDSLLEAEVTRVAGSMGNVPAARARAALDGEFSVPALYPPLRAVLAGGDGRVWLEFEGAGETRWLLLDAELVPQAFVELPAGFRPMQAVDDRVWGIELNEYDVPRVLRYRVRAR